MQRSMTATINQKDAVTLGKKGQEKKEPPKPKKDKDK